MKASLLSVVMVLVLAAFADAAPPQYFAPGSNVFRTRTVFPTRTVFAPPSFAAVSCNTGYCSPVVQQSFYPAPAAISVFNQAQISYQQQCVQVPVVSSYPVQTFAAPVFAPTYAPLQFNSHGQCTSVGSAPFFGYR